MNASKIKFLGIRFLRIALSLEGGNVRQLEQEKGVQNRQRQRNKRYSNCSYHLGNYVDFRSSMPGTKDRDSVCVCVCVCVCVFYNFTGMEETHQLLIPMAIEVTYIIFRFGHMNSTNCRGKCREAGRGLLTMGLPRSTTWTCKQDPSAPSTWSHSSVVLSEL